MVDAGAYRPDVAMRARGRWPLPATCAIVGNGDAAARRARGFGRLGIVGCGDARAGENRLGVRAAKSACGSGERNRAGDRGNRAA